MAQPLQHQRPPTIDPIAAERSLALSQAQSPWLHEEVARRMAERLQWMRRPPQAWWHWQPSVGGWQSHQDLSRLWPKASCWWSDRPGAAELSRERLRESLWKRLTGPTVAEGMPPPGGVQMVWANMSLHRTHDPAQWLAQWFAALQTDGMLMFSCLGPDSVRELRRVYADLGWSAPSQEFTDMHDWGDMTIAAGFAEPVMDMERITLSWSSAERMLAELRTLGRNLHPARSLHTNGRKWRERWLALMDERLRSPDGRLKLSFEVIYGHAIRPELRVPLEGTAQIGLDQMRGLLSRKPNRA